MFLVLQSADEVLYVNIPQILRLALPNSAHRIKFYCFSEIFFCLIVLFDFILRLACDLDKATFK